MPDLGKYATEVLSAYGVSLFLIIGFVWISIHQSRRVRAQLKQIEGDRKDG